MLLSGAALTACAHAAAPGAPTGTSLDSSFEDRVEAVCTTALAERDTHPFPLQDFDPRHPKSAQMPVVAHYFEQYGGNAATLDQLTALGEPQQAATGWNELLQLLDKQNAMSAEQVAAARRQDLTAWDATLDDADRLHGQMAPLASRLGFASSSPCARLFG